MGTQNLDEGSITAAVLSRMRKAKSARFKKVMGSLVRHLHEFAREVRLTEEEWAYGIDFLTRTGQKCDDARQEFILLSDTLGLSTLLTQLNHRSEGAETEQTVWGPFHRLKAPVYPLGANISEGVRGAPCFVTVTVRNAAGLPVRGATVDVWHSDDDGFYDTQHAEWKGAMKMRGLFKPDANGKVWFRTILPTAYPVPTDGPVGELLKASARHPMRPAHMHFLIKAQGYDQLVTHVFVKGDKYLDSDAVFGVRTSLVKKYEKHRPGVAPDGTKMRTAVHTLSYDFVLRPEKSAAKSRTATTRATGRAAKKAGGGRPAGKGRAS
jgi:hydroxyquinol 1,2-dioxygenase